MSYAVDVTDGGASLRQRATEKLTGGASAALKRASASEALAVLYQLASSPSTATEAMALLHELQVHQVEVDLQQEEFRDSRAELEAALARQMDLVERAPAGFLILDALTVVCEINLAGARLLGGARDDLLRRPLTLRLSAGSADRVHTLLARARDGLAPEACELHLRPQTGAVRALHAVADRDAHAGRFVLVLMPAVSAG